MSHRYSMCYTIWRVSPSEFHEQASVIYTLTFSSVVSKKGRRLYPYIYLRTKIPFLPYQVTSRVCYLYIHYEVHPRTILLRYKCVAEPCLIGKSQLEYLPAVVASIHCQMCHCPCRIGAKHLTNVAL